MPNYEFLTNLFSAIDSKDSKTFCSFLTDDCVFTMGNFPPTKGKTAIEDAVGQFFNSISNLRHTDIESYHSGDSLFIRGLATYTRHNGSQMQAEFINHFKMYEGLVKDYRVFIDISKLYE